MLAVGGFSRLPLRLCLLLMPLVHGTIFCDENIGINLRVVRGCWWGDVGNAKGLSLFLGTITHLGYD